MLLFSSNAAQSTDIAKELAAAVFEKKLIIPVRLEAVSYTHLDVYKRQLNGRSQSVRRWLLGQGSSRRKSIPAQEPPGRFSDRAAGAVARDFSAGRSR